MRGHAPGLFSLAALLFVVSLGLPHGPLSAPWGEATARAREPTREPPSAAPQPRGPSAPAAALPGLAAQAPAAAAQAPAAAAQALLAAQAPAAAQAAGEPAAAQAEEEEPATLEEQRERLFARMKEGLGLSDEQDSVVRMVFASSPYLGQGNPALTRHPMGRAECRERRAAAGADDRGDPRCGAAGMVPVYNREAGETADQARVCIDRFEFPGLACEYPVTYARASEASILCRAVGKRLCDAHEWEGACAGSLRPFEEEYPAGRTRLDSTYQHNGARERVWSYGLSRDGAICATSGVRSPGCTGEWTKCGSNTYPAGSFPGCVSSFGVYDQHGNAAEHMSLPLTPDERVSRGDGGWTEMKGSWFGFSGALPHEDDCRWRAPDWHATRTLNANSHRNYHLSFRCCRDLEAPEN